MYAHVQVVTTVVALTAVRGLAYIQTLDKKMSCLCTANRNNAPLKVLLQDVLGTKRGMAGGLGHLKPA